MRHLTVSLLSFVAALGMGTTGASIEGRHSPALDLPPGAFVQVGDHRLHLYCEGEGTPTVVFDSGLGSSSLDWARVQPDVAKLTRACVYDRAGYGWSDPGPAPRDSATIVHELAELLGHGGVAPPYVLVGHSFGGFNVRLFASEHPDETAALVLIDSSHEKQFQRFDEAGLESTAPEPGGGEIIIENPAVVPSSLPADLQDLARSFTLRAGFMATLRSELRNLKVSAGEVQAAGPLPDVPLVVISHRVLADGVSVRKDKLWLDMQQELATRTSRAQLVMADTSDHYVQLTEPGVVVAAIRTVLAESRPVSAAGALQ
jgi:pimeloyl-ACP methyl ester carboxylesterase